MNIGFTGTSAGMAPRQSAAVGQQLEKYQNPISVARPAFHCGDCVGADIEALHLARDLGYYLVGHPPSNNKKRAFGHYDLTLATKPYLVRNHDIVDVTDRLIAAPAQQTEQLRSGTWATVRYARKKGRPITLVFPDGSVRHESQ